MCFHVETQYLLFILWDDLTNGTDLSTNVSKRFNESPYPEKYYIYKYSEVKEILLSKLFPHFS